jgi:hypothetical protein
LAKGLLEFSISPIIRLRVNSGATAIVSKSVAALESKDNI